MKDELKWGVCKYCGATFEKNSPSHVYCSRYCNDRWAEMADKMKVGTKIVTNKDDILEISRLAAAEGLSYGKYVAKHRLYTVRKEKK